MPFTGSHPAAVLPLLRAPLPASALVIGSIAPDLPFYLPLPQWYATHTWLAAVTTDLLLGLVAWALWHGLLAEPALETAPATLRGRLAGRVPLGLAGRIASVRHVVLLVAALVLGTTTHLAWDEFTHARRWGAEHVAALAQSWGPLPGYRWLQYASSVAGLAVLVVWFVRWWRRTPAVPTRPGPAARWVWPVLGVLGLTAGAVAGLAAGNLDDAVFPAAQWAGGVVLLAAVLLALGRRLGPRRSSGLTARAPGSRRTTS